MIIIPSASCQAEDGGRGLLGDGGAVALRDILQI